MKRPFLVFEDIQTAPRRKLFTLFGTEWMATPYAWLSLPFWSLLGIFTALFGEHAKAIEWRLIIGVGYGVLLFLTNALHSLGHSLAGKLLGAPLDGILLTATRNVNVHRQDQFRFSKDLRIGRALGGPLMNILTGLICLGILSLVGSEWLAVFGYFNLAIGIFLFFPVPSLDGWVIWGELFGFRGRG
jgi:Zn-dependent protease